MHKYTSEDIEALFKAASVEHGLIASDEEGVATFLLDFEITPRIVYRAIKEYGLSQYVIDMFDHIGTLYGAEVFNHDKVPETGVFEGVMLYNRNGEYSMSYTFKNGEEASCDVYLVPYSVREGFRLTDNTKVVNGILKGINRCGGKCPCHHPENDGDLTCPCESYRLRDKCCCNLYLPVNQ